MQGYLQRNELSHSYQTSFRANHFTDPRLSMLTDMTLNGAENGKFTGRIFINLEKTFDTLDHKILLEKMKCMGFSVKQEYGFTRILHIELFFISLDTVFFEARTRNCQVPQGSILGNLLFLLYINDILQTLYPKLR